MLDFLKKVLKKFSDDVRMRRRGFFTSFFKTTEEDYTDAEFVEIDIERNGDYVAPILKDARTGAVVVDEDVFTEKKFKPPYAALSTPIPLMELLQRQPGESDNLTERASWLGRLASKIVKQLSKFHRMFKENLELQCSQILQSGKVSLENEKGEKVYELDFGMKTSHKPFAATSWKDTGADPLADLAALCDAINDDGKATPSIAIFGREAWDAFIANEKVKEQIKRDGLGLGALNPATSGDYPLLNKGGRYMGYIDCGTYRLALWCYNDSYKKVGSSDVFKYMNPKNVIVTADIADLDFRIVFGGIPTLGMKEPFAQIVPATVTYDGFIRVHNRVFNDEKADTYTCESKMRGLAIPVSIDRFGCLDINSAQ